jgi:acyl-CoA thioesterase YciA
VSPLLLTLDVVERLGMSNDPQPHDVIAPTAPRGELSLRTLAMPADTNANGDIFGGWLLSQMDIAGGIFVAKTVHLRNLTVAIEAMTFRKPVFVGDVVSVYTDIERMGRTSITVRWRRGSHARTNRN